jgi:ribosomal protein S18 acetylase RimI-like enzyme
VTIDAIPDFGLLRPGPLSELMLARGIRTFHAAAALVRDLPYRRPRAAGDLAAVLAEGCGTCSSKHALLAALALEQGVAGIELVLGLYEMREENTPGVAAALRAHGLSSVPEAHCYLRCAGRRVDLTGLPAGPESPFDALLSEEPVEPARLAAVKGPRHRAFIERWAADRGLDPARVWAARERCIAALAGAWPAGVVFSENGRVDVAQLNALYRTVGWDTHGRRTDEDTAEMLRVSRYHIAAHTAEGPLVGFARVAGDPYVAQVLDVLTHPAHRRRGIATVCMRGVVAHLERSRYASVTLTDGSGIAGFYERFGFRDSPDRAKVWERAPAAEGQAAPGT